MRKRTPRVPSLFLAVLMLCLTALPAPASAESATAAAMQLVKTEGTVSVTSASRRSLTVRDNMRLYNGYRAETKAKSYAWISLDDVKLAKLDASTKAEVRKRGKKLELLVSQGNLFFNVTSPLAADETMNIRTSTMLIGIRGTAGWIKAADEDTTEVYVLEGKVECAAADPVSGRTRTVTVSAGERAVVSVRHGQEWEISREKFSVRDIDGFVMDELAQDPELCDKILEDSGLDIPTADQGNYVTNRSFTDMYGNTFTYTGQVSGGIPNGQGTGFWSDNESDTTYTGTWKDGEPNGTGTETVNWYTEALWARYEGEFKDGLPNGTGTLTWNSGEVQEGEWKDGNFIKGTVYAPDGFISVGEWKDGELISGTVYGPDGSVIKQI